MKVEFYKHNLGDEEKQKLLECVDSLFLTTGSYVSEFEEKLALYTGNDYAIGLTSCTAALHLSLLALGVGKGDEVITTPMTFIATSNAILYTGATPVFVDVDISTGLINTSQIECAITNKTKVILPVHLYGQMCDMQEIKKIADQHNLNVIEDAAHCIEGVRDGIKPGQYSDAACFSFYATKNITSGEGGAVVTSNKELASKIRTMRNHGISKEAADRYVGKYQHWDMIELGYKYNMFNIQASLLISQLAKIDDAREKREIICGKYEDAFASNPHVRCIETIRNSKSARHLFTILCHKNCRDTMLDLLQENGIGVAVNYRAVHLSSYYAKRFGFKQGMFPNAEFIGDRTLTLPLYTQLTENEVNYVIASVNNLSEEFTDVE